MRLYMRRFFTLSFFLLFFTGFSITLSAKNLKLSKLIIPEKDLPSYVTLEDVNKELMPENPYFTDKNTPFKAKVVQLSLGKLKKEINPESISKFFSIIYIEDDGTIPNAKINPLSYEIGIFAYQFKNETEAKEYEKKISELKEEHRNFVKVKGSVLIWLWRDAVKQSTFEIFKNHIKKVIK